MPAPAQDILASSLASKSVKLPTTDKYTSLNLPDRAYRLIERHICEGVTRGRRGDLRRGRQP